MALTSEEKELVRQALASIYGPWAYQSAPNPSEKTVDLLEELIRRTVECKTQIKVLFAALPCSVIGRGFLRRCLRAAVKILKENPFAATACQNVMAASLLKTDIFLSAQR